MAAAIALALLIALVPGRLGQFLCLGLQQFVEGFLYTASYQLLQLALDYFSFGCTIFPTWFAVSFQNGVSRLHSTRGLQTMSSFVLFSILRNLFYLIDIETMDDLPTGDQLRIKFRYISNAS